MRAAIHPRYISQCEGTHDLPWAHELGDQVKIHYTVEVRIRYAGHDEWDTDVRCLEFNSIELIDVEGKSISLDAWVHWGERPSKRLAIESTGKLFLESHPDCLREVTDQVFDRCDSE